MNANSQANFYISNLVYSSALNELVAGIFPQLPARRNTTQQIMQTTDTFVTETVDHTLQEKEKITMFPLMFKNEESYTIIILN